MSDIPLIHKITDFYKSVHLLSKQINKRDRFGIGLKLQNFCLDSLELSIESAYSPQNKKQDLLKKLKIKIEILKILVRIMKETNIVGDKKYIELEEKLIEISKMCQNWLNWSLNKESPR